MFATVLLFVLYISPLLDCSIFVYNSEDSSSVQDFDCFDHQSTSYCRRLSQPISLQRNSEPHRCYRSGINHSFRSLRLSNVTVHTVLQNWKSTLDKVDQYAHYLRQPIDAKDGDAQLCQCNGTRAFGRNCEYQLPSGVTLTELFTAKFTVSSKKLMYVGEIVCYSTLLCDFGLLCLDWRDICDGVQQCMSGLDEENCDKLEFNECEDNEYRCMNGMCIPDEYFLDGDYDCMDMSDEKEPFDDSKCPYQSASIHCDDRVCSPELWSCGDGQCVNTRVLTMNQHTPFVRCVNRREQFFRCEQVAGELLRTEPNGRCVWSVLNATTTINNYCANLLLCASFQLDTQFCPCRENPDGCIKAYRNRCSTVGLIPNPAVGLFAPYASQYFSVSHDSTSISFVNILNGTIRCREHLTSFTLPISDDHFWMHPMHMEAFICNQVLKNTSSLHEAYHSHYNNDSRTFNNRSYHWIDVCSASSSHISAYRINDGFRNCDNHVDEKQDDELVSKSCSNVRHHRFRCS